MLSFGVITGLLVLYVAAGKLPKGLSLPCHPAFGYSFLPQYPWLLNRRASYNVSEKDGDGRGVKNGQMISLCG